MQSQFIGPLARGIALTGVMVALVGRSVDDSRPTHLVVRASSHGAHHAGCSSAFRGPSDWNLDASLFRTIPFDRFKIELRVESQNVLNHPQFGIPVTGFTDPNFMRIRSFDNNRVPRTVQFGVRFAF